jgi:hypothetical protein
VALTGRGQTLLLDEFTQILEPTSHQVGEPVVTLGGGGSSSGDGGSPLGENLGLESTSAACCRRHRDRLSVPREPEVPRVT